MSAAPTTTTPKSDRAGRLLNLVRALIDYGRQLATTFRSNLRPFGTSDIALILAHITRGLLRAEALEARIIRDSARLDAAPPRAPSHYRSPPARAAAPSTDAASSPEFCTPTPEQIAAEVRGRPIGAVIADICRDLGIMPNHPLWPELRDLITRYGGNLVRLVKDIFDRTLGPVPSARSLRPAPAPALQSPAPAGTGPP